MKSRYLSDTILCFIGIIRRSYDIRIFPYPDVGFIFNKSILYRSHKLSGVYPTGTLDSCYGTQNEQKNTQNTVIGVEIRILST